MSLFNIEEFLDLSNYITDKRKNRRKNHGSTNETAEFFTPYSIVKRMCDKIPDSDWEDPTKTFLESSFMKMFIFIYNMLITLKMIYEE